MKHRRSCCKAANQRAEHTSTTARDADHGEGTRLVAVVGDLGQIGLDHADVAVQQAGQHAESDRPRERCAESKAQSGHDGARHADEQNRSPTVAIGELTPQHRARELRHGKRTGHEAGVEAGFTQIVDQMKIQNHKANIGNKLIHSETITDGHQKEHKELFERQRRIGFAHIRIQFSAHIGDAIRKGLLGRQQVQFVILRFTEGLLLLLLLEVVGAC
mmetsp:Transcript_37524/g.94340  ORF Transcript_37524/g.94340 Transcript_37524/m.94340 type:complete len:217 (-) Transcript_37524:102-752(-)